MIGPVDPMASAEAAIAADHAYADPALWIHRIPDAAIRDRALELSREGARGRPLFGVPFAVKDNIDIAGLPTTAACPEFEYTPQTSAPAVQRLLDAGALLIGKTNLDQFAAGLVGVRSPYGTPRNVFDPARVPGGSSSGSAIAVAAGIVTFALGTDTAGSGRVPAAFGNIVGLKPTVGALSSIGMVPACRSIDTISIFARTVDEALAVQRVAAAYDPADAYAHPPPAGFMRRGAFTGDVRIGIANIADLCDPAVSAAYAHAASAFANVEIVDIAPFLKIAKQLYDGPWVSERTAALRDIVEQRPDILHPVTRTILAGGLDRLTVDAFDAFHLLAQTRRVAETLFARIDALLLPTAPFCPTIAELEADGIAPNSRLGTFTNFVNLCGLAGWAVPAGFGPDGFPCGVVLLGPTWSEFRLAAIADMLHRRATVIVGNTQTPLPPPAEPDPLAADETPLFCVGAHMAGLPLNDQITSLGGRFLRVTSTKPVYRFYAMGERPGLVAASDGAAIEGEVWALPAAAIGPLLAKVPPPLCFGTVKLADGPCLGFLAEADGVREGTDITALGGWRAWLVKRATA